MTGSAQYASHPNLVCHICAGPIALETSKTDEQGYAVHEDCYVSNTIRKFKLDDPMCLHEDWLNLVVEHFEPRLRLTDNC